MDGDQLSSVLIGQTKGFKTLLSYDVNHVSSKVSSLVKDPSSFVEKLLRSKDRLKDKFFPIKELHGRAMSVLDNFSNSSKESITGIGKIYGSAPTVIEGDIGNSSLVMDIFSNYDVNSVLHFSGLKSVEESMADPLKYYIENVGSSLSLLRTMQAASIHKIIFSSSATVYDPESQVPYTENSPTNPKNPYGHTKLCIEQILQGLVSSNPKWRVGILRYFNPVGAHPSGHIGEDPKQMPTNLMPLLMQTAIGRKEKLLIFGDDYDTPEGTCIRDNIHV